MNSGTYTFEKPTEPEPAPTVSLYNLLDHSREDLYRLSVAVRDQIRSIEDIKLTLADTYTSLCAWKTLIDSAIIEKHQRDSEAWAEKTAKEIVSESKCTGDCYFLPVGGPYSPMARKKCETCGIIKD